MRVAGHELQAEGAAFQTGRATINRRPERIQYNTVSGVGFGLCSCRAQSPILDSAAKRKAWHREHKQEMLR